MEWYEVPLEEQRLAEEMAQAVMESFLPISDATNAYDLLQDVYNAIEVEPLRYDQGSWFAALYKGSLEYRREEKEELANCGTMACIAGWAVTLKRQMPADIMDTARVAGNMLGFSWDHHPPEYNEDGFRISYGDDRYEAQRAATRDLRNLFDDNLYEYIDTEEERDEWNSHDNKPGTAIYVKLGLRKIRQFMDKYEDRLKAKAV